jgi:hypothetical protein
MARIARGEIRVLVDINEMSTDLGAASATANLKHRIDYQKQLGGGLDDGELDRVHGLDATGGAALTTTPTDIDLAGSLSSAIGAGTTTFVELTGILIWNKGTVNILLGGDAAFVPLFSASNDVLLIPPGIWFWSAELTGVIVTATTGDILQLAAASGTVEAEVILWGRSAAS